MKKLGLAVAVLAAAPVWAADADSIAARLQSADLQRGQRLMVRCLVACHTVEKDGKHRVGPNLWGVVGAPMAARDGYRYSPALKARAAKGGRWDYAALDAYIASPMTYLPGGTMRFVGIKSGQQRADIILYLRSLSDDSAPLPKASAR